MNRQERLRQARENVEEAMLLAREHMGNKAVLTKYYHVMMSCLFALFNIRDIGKLTHADIIGRFEQEYVHTGKMDEMVLAALHRTYDLTHECDCDHMPVPTEEEITSAMKAAQGLIDATEGFLGMEVTIHEDSAV
jgi:uncharacterized protein (UPF0332 family)